MRISLSPYIYIYIYIMIYIMYVISRYQHTMVLRAARRRAGGGALLLVAIREAQPLVPPRVAGEDPLGGEADDLLADEKHEVGDGDEGLI